MADGDTNRGSASPGDYPRSLIARLKRIEGQARGLQKMLEEGRDCEEVIIQLAALKAAVSHVGMAVIGEHMADCLRDRVDDPKGSREALDRAVKLLLKLS
ncbi:MAG: metal-sensitive transcriptional regulator [Chloroflexota bacterium]